MKKPRKEQFSGCLLGQCLGDALGFVVEGYGRAICKRYVEEIMGTDKVLKQTRGPFPFGQYSDDTQLAREFLLSHRKWHRFSPTDYADRISRLFVENRVIGRGRATEEAALRIADGIPWKKAGTPAPSAGNGSAMRAGVVGMLYFNDIDALIKIAVDQGRITHQDKRCAAGSIAIASAVAQSMREEDFDLSLFLGSLEKWTRSYDPIFADAMLNLPQWLDKPIDEVAGIIQRIGRDPGYSKDWDGISPFVTCSVIWSVYAFAKYPDDYWKAICTAIEVGGDVDTTASMTGAISGARVGLNQLPSNLTSLLNDQEEWTYTELVELAESFWKST